MATVKELKQLALLDVAQALGMEMKRQSGNTYYWTEHDSFKINTDRNIWHWFSQDKGGDVFDLVQEIREVSFKEAKHFLETGEFPKAEISVKAPEPFRYSLGAYEHPDFNLGKDYLKDVRGLSEETIRSFLKQGNLAEATRKKGDYYEPVIVFKAKDYDGKVIGASLQGIVENWVQYPERGRLKQLMPNSDGLAGFSFDIGTPKRLVFLEAPIDLMSYYELHKESLQDVRLVSMDGVKKGLISRYTADLLTDGQFSQTMSQTAISKALDNLVKTTETFKEHPDLITLAVDNDAAGLKFIERLREARIPFTLDLPPKQAHQEKMDWNDYLKKSKSPAVKEKAPDRSQEPYIGGELFNRNSSYLEGEPTRTALQPEESKTQPDFPANVQLHFNIDPAIKSSYRLRGDYHYPNSREVRMLNRYASQIQESAQNYLKEFANKKYIYAYHDDGQINFLEVQFDKRNWMHLTGIMPVYEEHLSSVAEKFIDEVASGNISFPNVSVSGGFIDKMQVLPMLPEILESDAFAFTDLSEVEKFNRLQIDKAIQPEAKDLLVALRLDDNSYFPASMIKVKGKLKERLEEKEKIILGVFSEVEGNIQMKSFNPDFIKDSGKEMLETLQRSREVEPFKDDLNLQNGGVAMPDTTDQNLRNRFDQILREAEEKRRIQAQENKIIQDSDADGLSDEVEYGQGTDPFGANVNDTRIEDIPQPKADTKSVSELLEANDIKALAQHMKERVNDYFDSTQYKTFLTAMSHFNNYSPRNIQLLLAQNPDVTKVASFKTWKTEFGRSVNKGEKSLRIWAPSTVTQKDPVTGQPKLDKEGNEIKVTRFRLVPVFDVSQTNGRDLPKAVYELEGTHEDYANLYRAAKTVSQEKGVSFKIDPDMEGKASGFYSPKDNQIVVRGGMSEQQTLKTIFHEMAHSDLHNPKALEDNHIKRSNAELQAESVAYVVANHYGLDTSDYSFGYLARWSSDPEALSDLEEQLSIVQKEAKSLIGRLDNVLEKQVTKVVTQSKFMEQMNAFKKQSQEKIEAKQKERLQEEVPKKAQARQELNKP